MSGAMQLVDRRPPVNAMCQPTYLVHDLLERIRKANMVIRWLRTIGHSATSLQLQGAFPTIQVPAAAAPVLKAAFHGCNWTNVDGGLRLCKVIFQGCAITWYEQADNNQTKREGASNGE